MSGVNRSHRKSKKSVVGKMAEIRRSNNLRVRIQTYCRRESFTQSQLAERMNVSNSSMSSFMTGQALTGSAVYAAGMKYLVTRIPLSSCSDIDINNMTNDKWTLVSRSELA